MQVRHALAILALFLLSLISCGEPGESRVPTPEATDEPPRVAVLSPAIADVMRDIGMGELLVARHSFDQFSDPSLPIVGDQTGLDYEALIRVNPTHVILERSATGMPPELERLARERSWSLVEIPMLTLDDILWCDNALITHLYPGLMTEFFDESAAYLIIPFEHVARHFGTTMLVLGVDPIGALGPDSHHAQALRRMGIEVVPSTGASYQSLSLEDVIAFQPDTIIVLRPDMDAKADAPLREVDIEEFATLNALTDTRLLICEQPKCLLPSMAVVKFANAVLLDAPIGSQE
ncbi:MAG: hypothetical protein AAGD00_08185 [Planctomycetota bacterium]